jgi:hypothetical protein
VPVVGFLGAATIGTMLALKRFRTVAIVIAGIELLSLICKE